MKTTTLCVSLIAAVAVGAFALTTPTYAQQVTSETERPQVEQSTELKESGRRSGRKGHRKGVFKHASQYFENLTDEQKESLKEELKALKSETPREEIKAMSEEQREIFRAEIKTKRDAIVIKYVDAEDIESGAYAAFVAQQELNHETRKTKRQEKQAERKTRRLERFEQRVSTLDSDEKTELLAKTQEKFAAMTTRIQESDRTDEQKEKLLSKVQEKYEMIISLLM